MHLRSVIERVALRLYDFQNVNYVIEERDIKVEG